MSGSLWIPRSSIRECRRVHRFDAPRTGILSFATVSRGPVACSQAAGLEQAWVSRHTLGLRMSSFLSHLIRRLVERGANRNGRLTLAELRRSMEKVAAFVRPPRSIAVEAARVDGVHGEWHVPKRRNAECALLYLHGGAFCSGSPVTHRHLAGRIAKLTQAVVLVPDYRLAPEYPFPAALDDSVTSYRELLRRGFPPERIVVIGDSAGGNLTLSLLLRLRDFGERLPAAAVCLSPVTDLARADEETKRRDAERAHRDPMIRRSFVAPMVAKYVGGHDPSAPLLSPLFASLEGLPPILIQAGGDELLLPDAELFAGRARRAGVEVTLQIYPRMWHVWQIFVPYLPEARRAVRAIADFVCVHAGRRTRVEQAQR